MSELRERDASRSAGAEACNRQPFLSEDGCDRGEVDTHQFDDLPLCQTFNPTRATVPPNMRGVQLSIPAPFAPCACVNIDYNYKFNGFKDKFAVDSKFKAKKDCCNGNYQHDMEFELPCVIPDINSTIKVTVGWGAGTSDEKPLFQKKEDECSFDVFSPELDIKLPCPLKKDGLVFHRWFYDSKKWYSSPFRDVESDDDYYYVHTESWENVLRISKHNNNLYPCCNADRWNTGYWTLDDEKHNHEVVADFYNPPFYWCKLTEYLCKNYYINCGCVRPPTRGRGRIKITFGWVVVDSVTGKEKVIDSETDEEQFAIVDSDGCSINVVNPELRLDVKCPFKDMQVKHKDQKNITVEASDKCDGFSLVMPNKKKITVLTGGYFDPSTKRIMFYTKEIEGYFDYVGDATYTSSIALPWARHICR